VLNLHRNYGSADYRLRSAGCDLLRLSTGAPTRSPNSIRPGRCSLVAAGIALVTYLDLYLYLKVRRLVPTLPRWSVGLTPAQAAHIVLLTLLIVLGIRLQMGKLSPRRIRAFQQLADALIWSENFVALLRNERSPSPESAPNGSLVDIQTYSVKKLRRVRRDFIRLEAYRRCMTMSTAPKRLCSVPPS
jgi:hypothetical protein